MRLNGLAISMGLGAAVGAVGILMLSRTNPARQLAAQAANKVGDTAWRVSERLSEKLES